MVGERSNPGGIKMKKRVKVILAGLSIAVCLGMFAGDASAWRCGFACAPFMCAPVPVVCAPVIAVCVPRPVVCVPAYCWPAVPVRVVRPWRWCW